MSRPRRPSLQQAFLRGRVSRADVPFTAPWYRPLLSPVFLLTNAITAVWVFLCWRTIRIRWVPTPEALLRRVQSSGRPLIYYSWHAYSALGVYSFLDGPRELMPILIGHDGFNSQLVQRCMAWFGWHVWFYRRHSSVRRRQQIIDLVRTRGCHIALMADGGGPYGRVKSGLVDVAEATNSLLVPFVLTGRRILRLERPRRYRVPFPFSQLTFHHGEPLDGRATSREQCQHALDTLESGASATPSRS